MKEEDLKYFYASEKLKGNQFDPKVFHVELSNNIQDAFNYGWVIETDKPIGAVFGIACGPFTVIVDMIWFPWATKRNRIEGAIAGINWVRKKMTCLLYCEEKDKDYYVHIAKYGILRRIGKIEGIYDKPATLFQTRS